MLYFGAFVVSAVCVMVDNMHTPVSISQSGQYVQRSELYVWSLPIGRRMPNLGLGGVADGRWRGV